ncbi:MAG: ABC transporter ATP-binding protein/permease [Bacilli bacterium]|nr:ABC transporter ATP-binding protein/permease [Bacilli bacterium]
MWQNIKLILKSVRQYKKPALITPLFMIGEAAAECIMPFIMGIFVDEIKLLNTPDNFFHTDGGIPVFYIALILLGLAIFSLICGIMGGKYASIASVGLAANLRSDLYKKLTSFSFENIDKFSTSSLVTRMTTDINNVQMAFQMMIRIVIRAPLMLIFSAVMTFVGGGPMGFVFVALVPIVSFGLFLIVKHAMKVFTRVFKRYDALNQSVQENVSGIRVVKSYVREDFEKDKFDNASDGLAKEFILGEKIVALNGPLLNTAIHLSNIIIIAAGCCLIYTTGTWTWSDASHTTGDWIGGILTLGQLSALITYGIQILMSLMMISMIAVMLTLSLEAIKRIGEVLKEEPTIKDCENPLYDVPDGSVKFDKVYFKYKSEAEKYTLENINIDIKSGQFIGILGSTGSGKTSVINLISRLYEVTEGELLVGGHDVKEYDLATLRNNVSVVLQKNVLFSGTIASNLQWGDINASEEEMMKACKIAQAEEIVNAKPEGLQSRVEQGGANFSGGQKQRLCIARAIMKKPKILILDDSTSAVDTKTDRLIRRGLKEDLPEMTKIVIAQRISSIEDADQIIILDDGKINAIGTHEELLKSNKIYQEVYYTQNKVGGDK